ncbi:MAG: peptide chain release factor-like protein [Thermoguttaceae bacterium]
MHEPPVHPAALSADALFDECDMRRLRRSGPGGQHRNKVETAVVLLHRPTGVSAEANERRSQAQNRKVAISRLRVNLALKVRAACESGNVPSALWKSRCTGGRISVSPSHDDFPIVLAEALDTIDAKGADVKEAALALQCTASQLIKLLKAEPRAMAMVNQWRDGRGLHPLR